MYYVFKSIGINELKLEWKLMNLNNNSVQNEYKWILWMNEDTKQELNKDNNEIKEWSS